MKHQTAVGGLGLSCWTAEGLGFEYRCGKKIFVCVYLPSLSYKCCMLIYALSDTVNFSSLNY